MIDITLIKNFRDKVNSNSYFILHKYRNNNGKNHWNLICACMDWINVAIDYLGNNQFDADNINIMSMQVYTYISSIDIIWQSIQQLHRALIDANSIPFNGQKVIFKNNNICKDDNDYFKHIRAVFGAHSVNIVDKNGKWFASWPTTGIYDEYDFAVMLYSSEADSEDIVFGFKFSELEDFSQSRYEYLNTLAKSINNQYKQFVKEKTVQKIKTSSNILEQLEVLRSASKDRLDNDYYKYIIDELIIIFEAENSLIENKEVVESYRNELSNVISELLYNLQTMKFEELKTNDIINQHHPRKIHYSLSKIFECLNGSRYDLMFGYYIKEISEFLKDYVIIEEQMHDKEIYMLIKAGLYNYWKNRISL